MKHIFSIVLLFSILTVYSQEKVYQHFKCTRIINLQSVESLRPGVMELKILHRFGAVTEGASQLWGLDQATMRIALEYGLTDKIMFGFGRSTFQKTLDGFVKFKILEQRKNEVPLAVSWMSTMTVNTQAQDVPFEQRLAYVHQLILSSKLNDRLTLQLSPTAIHRNVVPLAEDNNLAWAIGSAFKYSVTKVMSLNAEYIWRVPPTTQTETFKNNFDSFSLGLGFDTKGHFFEFHVTNSFATIEKGFILETNDTWSKGNVHLGFNIVRDFRIRKPRHQ